MKSQDLNSLDHLDMIENFMSKIKDLSFLDFRESLLEGSVEIRYQCV